MSNLSLQIVMCMLQYMRSVKHQFFLLSIPIRFVEIWGVYLSLVHTSDGIGSGVGIGSARSVAIQCKSKIGIGSGVGSLTKSESEGSEEFLFLPIPLLLPSLPIQ